MRSPVLRAILILLALAAIRLLPRALRREARAAELVALLWQVTAAAALNTSKAVATEARTSALEVTTGKIKSQAGTVSNGFGASIGNLSQTQTGTAQPGGSGVVNSGLPNNNTTSGASAGTAHTHGMQNHTHRYDHFHFTQVEGDYNTFAASYDATLTTVTQMWTALRAAGLL